MVMIALYNGLHSAGLVPSVAWRAAFLIVPVPSLLFVATATMVFGTDHPAGKWSDRHKAITHEHEGPESAHTSEDGIVKAYYGTPDEGKDDSEKKGGRGDIQVTVVPAEDLSLPTLHSFLDLASELDFAISEPTTLELALKVASKPLTWLPALAYLSTFGYELAIDANLANVFLILYQSSTFGQTKAGYVSGTTKALFQS